MTCNPRVEVDVRITPEDMYRSVITVLAKKAPWYSAQLLLPIVLILALSPYAGPTFLVLEGSIVMLVMAVLIYLSASKGVRTNKIYEEGVHYSFGDSGVDINGPTFFFHYDWSNFHTVMENSHAILLCPSKSQVSVIPKRCFASPSHLDSMRALIRSKFTGKVHLRD
jgi:hypothetical protein